MTPEQILDACAHATGHAEGCDGHCCGDCGAAAACEVLSGDEVCRACASAAISAAVAEENEACAKVADEEARLYSENAVLCDATGNHYGGTVDMTNSTTCERVSMQIRSRRREGEGNG